ncbi:MAG: sugar ABC transporter permease [Clostridia bacterium]|nr:sugar ABC transporter permease [Clostridia bacterium]
MNKFWAKIFFPITWLFKKLADLCYDAKSYLYNKFFKRKKEGKYRKNTVKIRDAIFYAAVTAIPLIMFVLVNVVINGNAILLAFQEYDGTSNHFLSGNIFENFAYWIDRLTNYAEFKSIMWRSVEVYLITTVLCTFVPILFSYYVYKKMFGHKVFKILLFLPSILSSIITVSMFRMFVSEVIPSVYEELTGKYLFPPLKGVDTAFSTIMFYNVWMALGGGLLTQLAAMNTVDPSVAESAQLEGIGFWGEFWHIVLPACYEVLTLGFVTGIAGIFTNSLNLYAFYGTGAPNNTETIGYYITVMTLDGSEFDYPKLSAWGVMVTVVVTPLTLLLRHLINRYGPSEDSHEKRKTKKAV